METGAKIFILVGIILGVFLIFYIGTTILHVYKSSMSDIKEDSDQLNIDCVQYSFDAGLEIDGKTLLYLVNSKLSSFQMNNVTLDYGDTKEYSFKRFAQGDEKIIDITNLPIEDKFRIYPTECPTRFRECSLSTGVCR